MKNFANEKDTERLQKILNMINTDEYFEIEIKDTASNKTLYFCRKPTKNSRKKAYIGSFYNKKNKIIFSPMFYLTLVMKDGLIDKTVVEFFECDELNNCSFPCDFSEFMDEEVSKKFRF